MDPISMRRLLSALPLTGVPAQAHNRGGRERRSGGKESEAMRLRYFLEDTLSVLTFRGHVTEGGIVLLSIVRCTPTVTQMEVRADS